MSADTIIIIILSAYAVPAIVFYVVEKIDSWDVYQPHGDDAFAIAILWPIPFLFIVYYLIRKLFDRNYEP